MHVRCAHHPRCATVTGSARLQSVLQRFVSFHCGWLKGPYIKPIRLFCFLLEKSKMATFNIYAVKLISLAIVLVKSEKAEIFAGKSQALLLVVKATSTLLCVLSFTKRNKRLQGISYRHAIGSYEDLITIVRKRKLRWYGHIIRSKGLAKMILQGTVQGGRRNGRQKKRWEDNLSEWSGLGLDGALRKAQNREEWRKVVVRSSLMPQRPFRLRD